MDSNDISAALNKLLSDPSALANAMSIASSIMGNLPSEHDAPATEGPPTAVAENSQEAKKSDVNTAAVNDTASPINSLAALAPLLSEGRKNDPRCALLYALKPYLGHGRADKIDTLVNLLKIADIAGGLLGGKLL